MLVNSYGFQNPYNSRNKQNFGAKTPSIQELEATVKNLKERIAKHPYNRDLPALLKNAQDKLNKAIKASSGK